MDSLPPPPAYEEIDTSDTASATTRTQHSARPLDVIGFENAAHHGSVTSDDTLLSNNAGLPSHELPQFEDSQSHLSGAPYFLLRPATGPVPTRIIAHRAIIKADSGPQNVKFPDPAWRFEELGVNKYDWSTFLNHLFSSPSLLQSKSNEHQGYPKEKTSGGNPSNPHDSVASSSQVSERPEWGKELQRRRQIREAVAEWNTHFFRPRGILIITKFAEWPPHTRGRSNHKTPLYEAVEKGDLGRVKRFLHEFFQDPDAAPPAAAPPLYVAVKDSSKNGSENSTEIVKLLLEAGADADGRPPAAVPPVWVAADASNIEILTLLLEHGANPDGKAPAGPTAMYRAAERSDAATLKLLLDYGADPEKRPPAAERALHKAMKRGDDDVVDVFRGVQPAIGGGKK